MGNARKYLALALDACKTKQYEEAGIFLVQASQEDDADELVREFGAVDLALTSKSTEDIEEDNEPVDEDVDVAEDGDELDEWGDDESSTSAEITRRKYTTVSHIGKILAASMSAGAEEVAEDNSEYDEAAYDEFANSDEPDPDYEGEMLVPASFSSVKVKSLAVESPIKLKS